MPIRKYCSKSNLHRLPTDSLFVVNHYLGSYEQFTYRENDARNTRGEAQTKTKTSTSTAASTKTKVNVRNAEKFREQNTKALRNTPETDDEIRPWLGGFLQGGAEEGGHDLLEDVGQLASQSWQPFLNNKSDNDNDNNDSNERCALLFFGLTRSYKDMALPGLIRNVLQPNARHGCDVYVHFYRQEVETPGRRNPGGQLRPNEIMLLEEAVQTVARDYYDATLREQYQVLEEPSRPLFRPPIVAFTHDTLEEFQKRRSDQMRRYHQETVTTTMANGGELGIDQKTVRAYFPWKARTYTNTSLDNIVKQWHSIQSVFKLMEYYAKVQKLSYSRVGMFRSDALYVTPIDIASLGSTKTSKKTNNDRDKREIPTKPSNPRYYYDVNNHYFVTPAFSMQPVNDRMVYGPYDAVKIWATKRFDLLEESAKHQNNPGWTMHSERFLNSNVFPAMEKLGYENIANGDICFLRTRADESAVIADCSMEGLVPTPRKSFWNDPESEEAEKLQLSTVESIVGKKCSMRRMSSRKWRFVLCGENQNDNNWGDKGWM